MAAAAARVYGGMASAASSTQLAMPLTSPGVRFLLNPRARLNSLYLLPRAHIGSQGETNRWPHRLLEMLTAFAFDSFTYSNTALDTQRDKNSLDLVESSSH